MKNKIVILGDPHFGLRNNSKYFLNKQLEFFETIFFPYIESNKLKELIILGDTFDNRRTIDISILNIFNEKFFRILEHLNVNTKIIIGNHDIFYKDTTEINSVKYLEKQFKNIKVIKQFEEIGNIAYCSWIVPNELDNFYNFIKETKSDILIGHFEISGFDMTQGHPCEDGIQQTIFHKFKKVISGHFHVRSKIGNIEYVSTQLEHNWSDYSLEKGFGILDTSNNEIEYINNPNKIYEKINYNKSFDIINFNYVYYTGKIIRIYAKPECIKDKKFDLFIDKISKLVYQYEVIPLDKRITETIDIEDARNIDTLELISKYIDNLEIDNKVLYKELLTSLYEEACNKINNDLL
jgi:DNA repair exonuclease SbcCD nuclease subunit